jgi:pyruvate carboxylase
MNPRIQVEHTVTEEITDVDLVSSQLRIPAGETLADLTLSQEAIVSRGAALQCRITTEDPVNGFRPDAGRIAVHRSPGGAGIRLDGGAQVGAEVSAHFDSMLVKLTCRGRDFATAVRRARRSVAEFRIRGVSTNIPFLQAVLDDPDFLAGRAPTAFIDEHPELLTARSSADRGTKIVNFLADVTVNKPHGEWPSTAYPYDKLPDINLSVTPAPGSTQKLLELGPQGFAQWLRDSPAVGVTDTTFRDAHQSLLATRLRSTGLLRVAPYVARMMPELLSVECWGGAAYDVALRFLKGPVGAAGGVAGSAAEHLPADAAAGSQHRGLHPLPRDRRHRLHRRGGGHRHRHLPNLRCAQQHREHAAGHRGGAGNQQHPCRSRDVLHR